jgi:hypothetical protein
MGENHVMRSFITYTLCIIWHMVKMIKSRRMGWAKYIANVGGMRKHCKFWPVNGN